VSHQCATLAQFTAESPIINGFDRYTAESERTLAAGR
jgi:hypothetical protein